MMSAEYFMKFHRSTRSLLFMPVSHVPPVPRLSSPDYHSLKITNTAPTIIANPTT